MIYFCRLLFICLNCLLIGVNTYALTTPSKLQTKPAQQDTSARAYRSFFSPTYHGERLNYCSLDGKACGLQLASQYCRMLGYAYANHSLIDYNVGLTNYLSERARCKGWCCHGFKTITCVEKIRHHPAKWTYYRFRRFVYPRYAHFRVDWCYDGQQGCGRRAAYSFCRRLGYLSVHHYAVEKQIAATKAIGNQKLCFGKRCQGFREIVCFR